jgi:hypothetical protein
MFNSNQAFLLVQKLKFAPPPPLPTPTGPDPLPPWIFFISSIQFGPGPLPHWIFSRLAGLPVNKLHLPQFPPTPPLPPHPPRAPPQRISNLTYLPYLAGPSREKGGGSFGGGLRPITNYRISHVDTHFFIVVKPILLTK